MAIIIDIGCGGRLADRALRTMFEDRKRVFVDLLKWDVRVLDERFELDEFDDEQAIYVIVADEHGDHLGSARLLRTDRPHILSDLFRGLCTAEPPRGAGILEITRFCLSPRQHAAGRRRTRNRLVSALALYALDHGIRTYTGVAELGWLQQVLAFGWDCRPLGVPMRTSHGLIGALAIDIRTDTPALLAANRIWDAEAQLPVVREAA